MHNLKTRVPIAAVAGCLFAASVLANPGSDPAADPTASSSRGGTVSGFVRDLLSNAAIAGARVQVQTQPEPFVLSAADGSFTLPVNGPVTITASVPYVRGGALQYAMAGAGAMPGNTDVVLALRPIPAADDAGYEPPSANLCSICHFPIQDQWSDSSHARSATNEWVLDLFSGTGTAGGSAGYVFRDTHDPGDTGFCATCHAPLADVFDPGNVMLDEVTGDAREGVSCQACHQIDSVDGDVNALHHLGNSTYRFPDDDVPTEFWVFGPLGDVSTGAMSAVEAPFFEEARFCASCHQYNNPTTGAPGQSTYSEWQASPWAAPGPNFRSCQTCHMPQAAGPTDVCTTEGPTRPADQVHGHAFEGSTPSQLQDAIRLGASLRTGASSITVDVEVENVGAGHSFPTGVSIRNAILLVEAQFRGEALTQTSGATVPFYADDDVPGKQAGDFAGMAGKGYARVLEGRINGVGSTVRPVLFIDAEAVTSDTRLPSGALDAQFFSFALPNDALIGEEVEVTVRLLYRRAYRATAVTKGWQQTPAGLPIEIEVARADLVGSVSAGPLEVPVGLGWLLSALLGGAGVVLLRRS